MHPVFLHYFIFLTQGRLSRFGKFMFSDLRQYLGGVRELKHAITPQMKLTRSSGYSSLNDFPHQFYTSEDA